MTTDRLLPLKGDLDAYWLWLALCQLAGRRAEGLAPAQVAPHTTEGLPSLLLPPSLTCMGTAPHSGHPLLHPPYRLNRASRGNESRP